jgi:hypothetical protein
MRKAIIIVSGIADGTTLFNLVAMNQHQQFYPSSGWWCWKVNHSNALGKCAQILGAPAERNDEYFDVISELREIGNKHYDFVNEYYRSSIESFNKEENVDLLLIYGVDLEKAKILQEDYGAFTLMVSSTKSNKDFTELYDKVLLWDDPNFTNTVVDFLTILTKDEVQLENKE